MLKLSIHRKFLFSIASLLLMLLTSEITKAQSPFEGLENLFTTPRNYVIYHTNTTPIIDGNINDDVWKQSQWTEEFRDIEGDVKPKPFLQTKVKMLWDDSCLYIAAQMTEPNVFAYQKHHDDVVFRDNDFEVFVNPGNSANQYYEIEVNALNTIFDLFLNTPYRDGGSAMINWNAEGLRSAVKVQGTLNDPADTDKGWTVEMAIPFRAISIGNDVFIPKDGTLWRINFSRVEWDTKVANGKYIPESPEHNWTWSAQGVVDMHFPERWGYLQFSKNATGNIAFTLPYNELQRQYLWLIYYREHQYCTQHHAYAVKIEELGMDNKVMINGHANLLQLEATPRQFMGMITDEKDKMTWVIDQQSYVRKLN
jgi:hypothetical protein